MDKAMNKQLRQELKNLVPTETIGYLMVVGPSRMTQQVEEVSKSKQKITTYSRKYEQHKSSVQTCRTEQAYQRTSRIGHIQSSTVASREGKQTQAYGRTSRIGHVQSSTVTEGKQSQAYERTSRIRREDKKSGNYQCYDTKEKVSSGQRHLEKGTGKVGVKNECKMTSNIKIGNRSGYTEYHTEQSVRKVDFGKNKQLLR